MENNKKIGATIMIVAILSIPIWLVLSDGYVPEIGFVGSFYYYMTVLSIKLKYLVLLSILISGYGFMVYKELAGNPSKIFSSLKQIPSLKRVFLLINDKINAEVTKERSFNRNEPK